MTAEEADDTNCDRMNSYYLEKALENLMSVDMGFLGSCQQGAVWKAQEQVRLAMSPSQDQAVSQRRQLLQSLATLSPDCQLSPWEWVTKPVWCVYCRENQPKRIIQNEDALWLGMVCLTCGGPSSLPG